MMLLFAFETSIGHRIDFEKYIYRDNLLQLMLSFVDFSSKIVRFSFLEDGLVFLQQISQTLDF